ncbi:uncharacterized protein LOC131950700 [Physella acuta]|uniref:uncharacterized protein LOC131950700 n=1 Tax=Physella acuta TaxID=109671 RepID=UPI0027DC7B3E|nr:uncharacterized protein LOC131950700 [Physella acuta]
MITHLLYRVILVYGYITLVFTACDTGWFGSSCQYKCHCVNNRCDDQGLCLAGSSCERGWFGPHCQYQDLSTLNATITPPNNLIADGEERTCTDLKNVTLSWTISYLINWIRIVFRDSATADILCNVTSFAHKIFFEFHTPISICSIYISGGRNVALNMATWQSSTYADANYGPIYVSSKAVDGNSSGDFYKTFTCTHTDNTPTPSVWGITFPQPMLVTRYVVYNRADGNEQRLKGFNLVSYNVNNMVVFNYTDIQQSDRVLVYHITTAGNVGVSYVNITAKQDENILTLCEVEVYGDNVCQHNTYGLGCRNTCKCDHWKQKSCFVATGQCFGGCDAGYFGKDCSNECLAGFYGENCSMNCSTSCRNQTCDRFNGTCTSCIDGKVGPLCETDCNDKFYGENCRHQCSINCTDQLCEKENGNCFRCISGQIGEYCQIACDTNHYGPNCVNNCSSNCNNSACEATTGRCFTCVTGYRGNHCEIACPTGYYGDNCQCTESGQHKDSTAQDRLAEGVGIGIGIMCVVNVIIVLMVCIFVKTKRSVTSKTNSGNKTNKESETQDNNISIHPDYTDLSSASAVADTNHYDYINGNMGPYDTLNNDFKETSQYEAVSMATLKNRK